MYFLEEIYFFIKHRILLNLLCDLEKEITLQKNIIVKSLNICIF